MTARQLLEVLLELSDSDLEQEIIVWDTTHNLEGVLTHVQREGMYADEEVNAGWSEKITLFIKLEENESTI